MKETATNSQTNLTNCKPLLKLDCQQTTNFEQLTKSESEPCTSNDDVEVIDLSFDADTTEGENRTS